MKIHRSTQLTAVQAATCALVAVLSSGAGAATIAGTDLSINGRIVAGIDVTNNIEKTDGSGKSSTIVRGASNQWGTSLLTFDAEHKFGNGNVGFATLENGFGADNGESNDGQFWSRRAFVGIKNDAWGKVQFGKNLSISNGVWDFDPMGQNWTGSETLVGGRNWNMASDAMEYWTPDLGGAGVGVQYAPGVNGANNTRGSSKAGIDVFYSGGPIKVHAIYDTAASPNNLYDNIYSASKEYIIGGTYQLGPAKLFIGYNHLSAKDALAGTPTSADQTWVGVNYQVNDPLMLRASVYTGGSNVDATVGGYGGKRGTLVALGVDYSLDKQLLIWSTLAGIKNGKNSRFSSEDTWNSEPTPGSSQETFNVGFSYSF